MTTPNFVRFDLARSDGKRDYFTSSTDIIDYFEPARTFGESELASESQISQYQNRVLAVPDHRPNALCPMVFTLGTKGALHLVRKTQEATAGWERIDLNHAFAMMSGKEMQVAAFDIDWDAEGKISIIVATRNAENKDRCQIYIAPSLDSETSDFSTIDWEDWSGRDFDVRAVKIARKEDGAWQAIISGRDGPAGRTYLLDSRLPAKSFSQAIQLNTGVSLSQVDSFDLGSLGDDEQAIHCLGRDARGATGLQSRAIPRLDAQGRIQSTPPIRLWSCPAGARVLALGFPTDDGANLYIGGDGIHTIAADSFDDGRAAPCKTVMDPAFVKGIARLVVAEGPDGDATIWAIDGVNRLWTTTRDNADDDWSPPLCIRKGVTEVAPVRADNHHTTAVILVYRRGEASYLWRDAQQQGIWQEAPIRVADPDSGSKVACFGTNFRVLTKNRTPRAQVPIQLTASVLSNLVVNGESVLVGPDLPLEITTKEDGSIGIFNRADTFTPASYRLHLPGHDNAIEIMPSAGIFERFRTLSAKNLHDAKLDDGSPLLSPAIRQPDSAGQVEAFANALNNAALLSPRSNSGVNGISFVKPDAPFVTAIDPMNLPQNYGLSVKAADGGIQVSVGIDRPSHRETGGFLKGIGETLSDALESIWTALDNGVSYVIKKVGDGIRFVCEIAGKVKDFVINTLEEIGGFFSNLWDSVVDAAGKVWEYLKFLFDWDDVLIVRNIISNGIEQRLKSARQDTKAGKRVVSTAIDSLRDNIASFAHDLGIRDYKKLPAPKAGKSGTTVAGNAAPNTKMEAAQNNGVSSWLADNLNAIFSKIIQIETPEPEGEEEPEMETGMILETVKEGWDALKDDIQSIVGPDFDIGDLTLDTIQRVLAVIALRLAETALGSVEVIIIKLLEVADKLLGLLHDILFSKIRLPFIETLIEMVSGKKIDTSFRLIDVLSLIVAIPTTLIYKIATGKRPPRELEAWNGDNAVFVQSGGEDRPAQQRTWDRLMAIAAPVFGTVYLAYSAFSANKVVAAGATGMENSTYGRLMKAKDAVGALMLFGSNVLGETITATKNLSSKETLLQALLVSVGLCQVAWKGISIIKRSNQFSTAIAQGNYRISGADRYKDTIAGSAVDLIFGVMNTLLKTLRFMSSSKSGVDTWSEFLAGLTKYLGQIVLSLGTWSRNPKILLAALVIGATSIVAGTVQAIAMKDEAAV
ncbi:hypothetical protein AAIB41_13100 [Brucella sp. BE17]|uniref:hypothetical protein n=1 Tax=Brucella sp. BE17 TaxID=3142977 RepID=UPI0031BBB46C